MNNHTNTSGGASVGGSVGTGGGTFIGRDQIINIITVGRFLEFANAQNLFPKLTELKNFENIDDAIEGVFETEFNSNLAEATAFAGEMLRDILANWLSLNTGTHTSLRQLIISLAQPLYEKLLRSGYWRMYSEEVDTNVFSIEYGGRILYLEATEMLWAEEFDNLKATYGLLCDNLGFVNFIKVRYISLSSKGILLFSEEIERWSTKQQRLFLAGIVLDLIRIRSESADNTKFLKGLIDSLGVSNA